MTRNKTDLARQAPLRRVAALAESGLWRGFLSGLAAMPLMYSHNFSPPRYQSSGLAGDWQAVGNDLRAAMRRFEEQS